MMKNNTELLLQDQIETETLAYVLVTDDKVAVVENTTDVYSLLETMKAGETVNIGLYKRETAYAVERTILAHDYVSMYPVSGEIFMPNLNNQPGITARPAPKCKLNMPYVRPISYIP